jgi:uncharacterized protein (DUF2267 family)
VSRFVIGLKADHISQGEIRDVRLVLPAELADLWPTAAATM